jgi:hypothetical protein
MIDRDYHYTVYVDDLPSAYVTKVEGTPTVKYENGVPIGRYNSTENQYYILNHLEMTIQVHETMDDKESYRIVGFKIEPMS